MIKKKKTINLLNNISNNITNINVIKQNQYILISISGGQDSIGLFFILLQLKRQWKWSFGIIYCNHLWQKNAFFANLLVVQLAYMFQIPVYCAITPNKIFKEHQCRYWRYDIFYRISYFYNYKIISTGHTSSDKVETILFQLIRGRSTKNLTSLNFIKYFISINKFSKNGKMKTQYLYNHRPFQKIQTHKLFNQNYFFRTFIKKTDKLNRVYSSPLLIRPVLNLHRFDLKKLSIFWNLPIYPDISNKKTYYYRNRIRKQLLPTLRFFFNPQIDIILLQFAEILTTEQLYLDIVTNRLKYEFQTKKKKILQLNISLFNSIPLSIQRKLVKKFLENYSCKQVYFFQIEYIIQIIIKKKKFTFAEAFTKQKNFKQKKFKQNFLYSLKSNSSKLNLPFFYWIKYMNKPTKKISLLYLYLVNKNVYIYLTYKKCISYKYIYFFKKQIFLSFADIFLYEFFFLKLKKNIHFSTYSIVYFLVKQGNKKSLELHKNKKKNTFNFIELTKKTPQSCTKKKSTELPALAGYNIFFSTTNLVKNKTQFHSSKLLYNRVAKCNASYSEVLNFLLHTYYFNKFTIFFYPEIGVLFYFQKKLLFLNN